MLQKQEESHYVLNLLETTVYYDEADCDGYCLIKDIVTSLKQISTYDLWKSNYNHLRKYYWSGKHYLWTRGYFCSTIGDVSEKTLKNYIENQG